jgi:UPF0176 protein
MFYISGLYKFKKITYINKKKEILKRFFINNNIKGLIIISKEGINGTIAAKKKNLDLAVKKIKKVFNFINYDSKSLSKSKFEPFRRSKVKIKKEVVPMGIQVLKRTLKGHIEPKNWNNIISDKNNLVVDARKPFEYNVGTFKNAINPNINNFREFPKYLRKINKKRPIAMFCTGGIRCEKASIYLEKKGFKNIYQLKGGIINYLKSVKKNKSLWKGECYVFDNRISLKHNLIVGSYSMCSGCRKPISKNEKKSKKYEEGVSCPKCHDTLTNSQKERFRMRQNQINLAKKAGKQHIFQKEY